ncbi:hypothetical protein CDL15_Pgr013228 [Punica granatum]|uniref:Uncharacterized protein n=1 Tax=Punica granatum TaxID=22663 RepID=A0A218WNA5_PUNGR|nr:hypothetical protein CDL15_Pgr013228 [Punica granatum]
MMTRHKAQEVALITQEGEENGLRNDWSEHSQDAANDMALKENMLERAIMFMRQINDTIALQSAKINCVM